MTDPTELASRFSIEDGMAYLGSIFEEPSEEDLRRIEQVKEILELLPACEADFVDLYFFRGLKQTEIAAIFRVSQPTVCYRLQRATARIQYLLQRPEVDPLSLQTDMKAFLSDPLDAEIMILMYETTCQSEVAKRLGVSQGLVRHRFIRSLRKMADSPGHAHYIDLFEYIAANLNILREVAKPRTDEDRILHLEC
jgi:DNA-directed RNA polymerase specialized sigma24 family protein